MEANHDRLRLGIARLNSRFRTAALVCLVAVLSFIAPKLAAALLLNPQTVWPLWPGCALLVSVLVLVPRRIWPIVIVAAFAGIVLYDVQASVPASSIAWFILADTVQVLTAALCLSHFFDGVPRLNSVKAVGKYAFFAVLLAPSAGAFLSAFGIHGDYWSSWRISFLSEALAFVTLTPAILSWVRNAPEWARKSRAYHLEFAALIAGLVILSYFTFTASENSASPLLFYSGVPFLLWAALRFGSRGVSSAVIVVSFLAIWGVVHDRGPFIHGGPLSSMLALQLFLILAAAPFMVLAALVEERKKGEEALREGEERLRLAMEAGKLGGWEWDSKSGRNPWFGETRALLGMTAAGSGSVQDFWERVHPENLGQLRMAIETAKQNHEEFDQEFRVVWPDGTLHWLRSQGRFFYAPDGEPERMLGISKDITERKQVEQALRQSEAELLEAQRLANVGSWQWDPRKDTVTWSEELYRIAGIDPSMPAVSYKDHARLYTPESWERLRAAVEEALRTGTPYELDLEMIRFDGTRRWLVARGEAHCDASGDMVQLHGTVHDITERKRTEEALRESEERLHLAVQAGGMYAYEWDPLTDRVTRSANCTNILGKDEPLHTTRQELSARVHPDDREQMAANPSQLTPEHPNSHMTYRFLRHDGTVIWLEKSARAFFDGQGRMLRMIGMVVDVTERKLAEEALSSVSRRLIEAHEEERTWIARELHDDINQRIALLTVQLEQWAQHPPSSADEVTDHIRNVRQHLSDLGKDVQALSHRLHSSKLEYLGLVSAANGFCRELSERQKVEIEFSHAGIPRGLPKETSLCLFRVLQEALQNAVKHSGGRLFSVELRGTSREIQLAVMDSGVGFDQHDATDRRGIGLVSMRERMQLVGGEFSIESRPGGGTTVRARVPFMVEEHRATTAG